MTNKYSGKCDPVLVANLNSGNEALVIKTIDSLRVKGNISYLPHLIQLLMVSPAELIRQKILQLLSELKEIHSRPFLIEAILDDRYRLYRKELIACCWKNGLDYSEYLPEFVDLVIQNELEIAFEAFTVIENMEKYPDPSVIDSVLSKIDQALQLSSGTKTYFLKELKSILA